MFLRDVQLESTSILSRWLLKEALGSGVVVDDVGGITLVATGSPTLGLPSMMRGDVLTSAQGGYSTQSDGFSAAVSAYTLTSGVSVEGVTSRDPNGTTFSLFNAPGQAQLQIAGASVWWSVWTAAQHTLTATGVILGYPQYILGTYDPVAQQQAIYVDGSLVASQVLSGSVAASTTGNTQLLIASASTACVALGQDVAVYDGALSANRALEHFQAFAQVWPDPGHVFTYPSIGVTQ